MLLRAGLRVILSFAILILFFIQIRSVQDWMKGRYNEPGAEDLLSTLAWIRADSGPEDVVLTTWTLGSQVVTYADRKVLATSKVYPSEIKTVAERYRDISRFFFSRSENETMGIVRRYNIRYILVPKKFDFWIRRYIRTSGPAAAEMVLTREGRGTTMVSRMLRGESMKDFELCLNSRYYIVYKVLGHAW